MLITAIIGLAILALIVQWLYVRYVPIKGIPCLDFHKEDSMENVLLDIRDYQQASNDKIHDAVVMPVPYLHRYYQEIPRRSLHIIASDHLEKKCSHSLFEK